eukprot:CCRYP_011116-RA/>CCRYP_011116-RA protein AED:0.31 eAED:0.59 QI:0/-1/0/1/-1/0/1/0/47
MVLPELAVDVRFLRVVYYVLMDVHFVHGMDADMQRDGARISCYRWDC